MLQASLEPAGVRELTYLEDVIRTSRYADAVLPQELASTRILGQRRQQGCRRSRGAPMGNSRNSCELTVSILKLAFSFVVMILHSFRV
jgi:hypothetical protein